MKTTIKIATLLSLSISANALMAEENQTKRYAVESAKISYEIKGSGDVMGIVKTETIGKKRLIFNQFGMNELTEENEIEKRVEGGKTETTKQHTLTHAKGTIIYTVNFAKKEIVRSKNEAMAMTLAFGGGEDISDGGEAMLKKWGGKKIGTDKVAGYTCDIWELMGAKQCMHKGIPLRIVSDVMGIKSTEIATKAEFDIEITKDDFKLPDFPVYDYDMDDIMTSGKPKPLDKSTLEEMDEKAAKKAAKEAEDGKKALKAMADAAKKAGIKDGEKATEAQQEDMMKNMQNAMFPMMKERTLKQVGVSKFGAKCLGAANTAEEANKCNKEAAVKFPSEDNDMRNFDEWSPEIKKEVLTDLNDFLGSVDCIKASNNMGDLQKCMPEDED